MKNHPIHLLLAASLALPAAAATHAGSAAACGNAVAYETKPAIKQNTRSEQLLGAGKQAEAVAGLLRVFPDLRADSMLMGRQTGIDPTGSRAQRLLAVAVVRTEGLLDLGAPYPSASARDRRANLEWAIGIFRQLGRLLDEPALQTDLGEALSKLPETRAEALTILDRLARKDLVTSSQGYAALADLRLDKGDRAGSDEARSRSQKMAHVASPAADTAPAAAVKPARRDPGNAAF